MNTIRIFGIHRFIPAIALSVGPCFVLPALANTSVIVSPDGKVTFLGTLGGSGSVATDINDAGQVVGYSGTAGGSIHAFITGPFPLVSCSKCRDSSAKSPEGG